MKSARIFVSHTCVASEAEDGANDHGNWGRTILKSI